MRARNFGMLIPDVISNTLPNSMYFQEPTVQKLPIFHDTSVRSTIFDFQFSGSCDSNSSEPSAHPILPKDTLKKEAAEAEHLKLMTGSWSVLEGERPEIGNQEVAEDMSPSTPPPTTPTEERRKKEKGAVRFGTNCGQGKGGGRDACCAEKIAPHKSRPTIQQRALRKNTDLTGSSVESPLTADEGRRVEKDEHASKGNHHSRNPSRSDGSSPKTAEVEGEKREGTCRGMHPAMLFERGEKGTDLNDIEQSDWKPLPKPMVVDSGAGETVMPKHWCMAHEIKDSPGSLVQDFYTTADGTKVYNEGQREMYLATQDGKSLRKMTFQVGKVSKALGSVSQMVDNGNKVVFETDQNGYDISHIENRNTREKIWLRRENGVYVLDMMVAPPSFMKQAEQSGFPRLGAR